MKEAIKITLTQEQKEALAKISISAAQTLFETLGVRFEIEDGKVEGLEI